MTSNSCLVTASVEQVFGVLSDYANYPLWTPDVVAATVLAREGDIVVAEFHSPFLSDKKYVIEFVQAPPTHIAYKQVDQFGERGVQGEWRLDRPPEGGGTRVRAAMVVRAEITKALVNRRRVRLILQRRLDALRELFGPAAAGQSTAVDVAEDALLDAIANEPATVSWRGARYLLTKIDR